MNNRIVKTKGILDGRPRINGTRIGVEHIMQYVNGGATIKEILQQYPGISGMDIQACLGIFKYSIQNPKEKRSNPVINLPNSIRIYT